MTARTAGLSLLCACAACAQAQSTTVAGPVAGLVFDRGARALRPILGVPGSAVLGDPLDLGIDIAAAAISPRQDSALVTAGDRTLHLFRLRAGSAVEVPLNGVTLSPERIVYSPSGSAAAVYAPGLVQVLTGLPDAPVPGSRFDSSRLVTVRAGRHRPFTGSFAISDDGAYLLAAAREGVQLFGAGGIQTLPAAPHAVVAFAPGAHDAVLVDASGQGVVLLKDVSLGASPQVLAAPDDAIRATAGVAFSANGARLYLATTAGQAVVVFDLATGNRTAVPCSCTPTILAAMGNLYRLNDLGAGPLWLLDPASPQIVFVPANGGM